MTLNRFWKGKTWKISGILLKVILDKQSVEKKNLDWCTTEIKDEVKKIKIVDEAWSLEILIYRKTFTGNIEVKKLIWKKGKTGVCETFL